MTCAAEIASIASEHGLDVTEVQIGLAQHGWDFSGLDMRRADHVAFVREIVGDNAAALAARKAALGARHSARQPVMTAQAIANPHARCTRCAGFGRIITFSHVLGGMCFACDGAGVRGRRGAMAVTCQLLEAAAMAPRAAQ